MLKKKRVSDLTTSKHPGSIGNSYIQSNEGKLFVASANGIFSFIELEQFFLENAKLNIIQSNISGLVNKIYVTKGQTVDSGAILIDIR